MFSLLQKIPFLFELFFNGTFILLYGLKNFHRLPESWNELVVGEVIGAGLALVPIIIFLSVVINYINSSNLADFLRKYVFSLFIFVAMFITWGDSEFCFWLAVAHLLSSILTVYDWETKKGEDIEEEINLNTLSSGKMKLTPAQVIIFSFTAVIVVGTFLLLIPFSAEPGKTIGLVDALFMATSATCVTGLSTISAKGDLSTFGQIVLLLLIQIGGLGIMTLSSSMAIILGKAMPMKDRIVMQELVDVSSLEDLLAMLIDILKYTFFLELWGAIILTIAFTFEGFEFGKALYYGTFHSISAFCNAGFALFDNSLESYATNPLIHGTIAILITFGGLGFIVLRELSSIMMKRHKFSFARITFHTKIVLVTSAILTFGGTIAIFFGEYLNALDGYSFMDKLGISFFQSVTLRTAGFNTIPLTSLHTYSLYMMCIFMFIGAAPGSTGGGIKVTTLAVLFSSIKSTLFGKNKVDAFNRTISNQVIVKTTALAFISISVAAFFILLLMKLEPEQSFLAIFFETISASGTVGLSLGITPYLSAYGKIALSVLMFIGRTGPLTLVLAVGQRRGSGGQYNYPDGRLLIG